MVEQVVVGIDVSKVKLDVAILPSGEQFTVSNDRHGVGELVRRLSPLAPSRVVLEATGKLEQLAVSELAAAGLPVVVINPAQVRHYAKARGKWAKTDPIDARLIAEFARDLEPELRPLPDAETQALAALCQRRNQLLEMEQMEKSRLQRDSTGQSEEHQSDAALLAPADRASRKADRAQHQELTPVAGQA